MNKEQVVRLVRVLAVMYFAIFTPYGIGLLMEYFVGKNPFSSTTLGIWWYGLIAMVLGSFMIAALVILSRPFYIYIKTGKFPKSDYDIF